MLVVRYTPTEDQRDANEALVADVFAELAEATPDGLRYATLRLADGTFVHLADIDGDNPLVELPAFARFQRGIDDRCEAGLGPNPQPAHVVGNYRMLAES